MTRIRSIWRRLHGKEASRGRRWDDRQQEQPLAPPALAPDRPAAAAAEQGPDITLDVELILQELRAHRADVIARIHRLKAMRQPRPTRPPDELDAFLERLHKQLDQPMKATWVVNKDLRW